VCSCSSPGPIPRGAPAVRVGMLPFGTGTWGLAVILRNGFDKAQPVGIEPIRFDTLASLHAALRAGGVDIVVLD
jgi:NitT/TauT family transport system substrate-binding protein